MFNSKETRLDNGVEGWRKDHPGWTNDGLQSLTRTFELAGFPEAVAFVVKVAMLAEKHNHHPDLDVRFNKVTVLWSTHDAGGLTRLDLTLAEATDALVAG